MEADPLCVDLMKHHQEKRGGVTLKKVVPSNEAHHIIARVEGGSDEWDNLMSLCGTCHKVLEGRQRKRTA